MTWWLDVYRQREVLIADESADLAQLRRFDRRLVAAVSEDLGKLPACDYSEDAVGSLMAMPAEAGRYWFEVVALLGFDNPSRGLSRLWGEPQGEQLGWWLLAHYPAWPCDQPFPVDTSLQPLAAFAYWRRGLSSQMPKPWQDWAEVMSGTAESAPEFCQTLWGLTGSWRTWFYPMFTRLPEETQFRLVNWLSGQAGMAATVEAMGVSCARRFLSWLDALQEGESLQADDQVQALARQELRWLRGNQLLGNSRHGETHHDDQKQDSVPVNGRQCWGAEATAEQWQGLFRVLPLPLRPRCWYWHGVYLEGGPFSPFGGRWCSGN